jgi:hypothetical protein
LFLCYFNPAGANNPYRNYLLTRIIYVHSNRESVDKDSFSPIIAIPKYQIPKGAIFCRMEDKVTRATKVWLKIGVQ